MRGAWHRLCVRTYVSTCRLVESVHRHEETDFEAVNFVQSGELLHLVNLAPLVHVAALLGGGH